MNTYQRRMRGVRFAAIALTLLSVPTVSLAQTDQPKPAQTTKAAAKKHVVTRQQSDAHRHLYGWNRPSSAGGCTSLNNQFPPCMSSWPQGSPNYHGPRPGPTFFDEQ